MEEYIRSRFDAHVIRTEIVDKEDLSLPNHLSGQKRRLLKLLFKNQSDLLYVKRALMAITKQNIKFADNNSSGMSFGNEK